MIENYDFVIISGASIDENWTSKQEIANVLSKTNRVLYVNPIPRIYKKEDHKYGLFKSKLYEYKKNLYVYSLQPIRLPFDYFSYIYNSIMQHYLLKKVRKICNKLNFKKIILWLFDFRSSCFIGKFNELISIYNCIDNCQLLTTGIHCRRSVVKNLENKTCNKVDLIFFTSHELKKYIKLNYNKDSYFFPHGINVNLFNESVENKEISLEYKNICHPVLGFVGFVTEKTIDIELVRKIAENYKYCSVVMIGEVKKKIINKFNDLKNIYFLGKIFKQIVPSYIKNFDVCLIPFKLNELTKCVNPMKLLDYLSMGKPVVYMAKEDVYNIKDIVYFAKSEEEFIKNISLALNEDDKSLHRKRMKFAKENSWDCQITKASEIIIESIRKKRNTIK